MLTKAETMNNENARAPPMEVVLIISISVDEPTVGFF
jgi:hypothetical protein